MKLLFYYQSNNELQIILAPSLPHHQRDASDFFFFYNCNMGYPETYSETSRTSRMVLFAKFNILDVRLGSEYASVTRCTCRGAAYVLG